MEDVKGSKRRQVCLFEPNTTMLINFFYRYMAYLLPALLKIGTIRSCRGQQYKEIDKTVRFEVDMALVVSADGFAWSRALKQKLEQGMTLKKIHKIPAKQLATSNLSSTCRKGSSSTMVKVPDELLTLPRFARPLAPFYSQMFEKPYLGIYNAISPKRIRWTLTGKLGTGDDELHYRMRSLRRILPGGSDMGLRELVSEVESYVICLELQVSILRTLLGARRSQLF